MVVRTPVGGDCRDATPADTPLGWGGNPVGDGPPEGGPEDGAPANLPPTARGIPRYGDAVRALIAIGLRCPPAGEAPGEGSNDAEGDELRPLIVLVEEEAKSKPCGIVTPMRGAGDGGLLSDIECP